MKTTKEFFDRIGTDEAFAKEVNEAIAVRREAGAGSYYETIIPVAEERGYTVTAGDLDEMYSKVSAEMSEEELGKTAGGTSCMPLGAGISLSVTIITTMSVGTILTKVLD